MRISVFLVMVHMVIGDGEVQGGCGREVGCGRVENEKPIVRTRQAGASGLASTNFSLTWELYF